MKAKYYWFVAALTGPWFLAASLFAAAAPNAALQKAKQAAEAKGYVFFTSRDEIVERAKKEGKLRVQSSQEPRAIKAMAEAFKKKYPFIDVRAEELIGLENYQRMLQAGIKASMAVRIYGDSLAGLAKASQAVANHLKEHHLVNAGTVNPDIVMGKPYYEFEVDREEAARYGMTTMMVNQIVSAGLGQAPALDLAEVFADRVHLVDGGAASVQQAGDLLLVLQRDAVGRRRQ